MLSLSRNLASSRKNLAAGGALAPGRVHPLSGALALSRNCRPRENGCRQPIGVILSPKRHRDAGVLRVRAVRGCSLRRSSGDADMASGRCQAADEPEARRPGPRPDSHRAGLSPSLAIRTRPVVQRAAIVVTRSGSDRPHNHRTRRPGPDAVHEAPAAIVVRRHPHGAVSTPVPCPPRSNRRRDRVSRRPCCTAPIRPAPASGPRRHRRWARPAKSHRCRDP